MTTPLDPAKVAEKMTRSKREAFWRVADDMRKNGMCRNQQQRGAATAARKWLWANGLINRVHDHEEMVPKLTDLGRAVAAHLQKEKS
jgi:hypothetical protein